MLCHAQGTRLAPQRRNVFSLTHSNSVPLRVSLRVLSVLMRMVRIPLYLLLPALATTAASLVAQPLIRTNATSLAMPPDLPATQYATERVFPSLSFTQPVALVSPPGDTRRLFVVEKPGRIWVVPDVTAPVPTRQLFLDITGRTITSTGDSDERGLLALAFHPQFASNGFFYVWYTTQTTTGAGTGMHDRLARFSVSPSNPNAAEPDSEVPLISQRDQANNHNGGELAFGPDGYLYLSLGDEGGGDDAYQNSQLITRDFFAGIIRIDVDRKPGSLAPNPHPSVHPESYSVPADNPFVGATTFNGAAIAPATVRTEFWAVGLRNPWRMSFDTATGRLWCADVGQGAREEIDIIVRGGNYGWNYREGAIAGPRPNPPASATFVEPVWDYPRSQGGSVTGGLVYRGNKVPSLYGRYIFADYSSGRIWALRPDGGNKVSADRVTQIASDGGISSFGLNPATGDILFADHLDDVIKRIAAAPAPGSPLPPATLSATGAFTSLVALTPAPGVVPYSPIASAWSDHASKRRWFALKDASSSFGFSAAGNWSLPTGAVWIEHLDLELTRGNPASARRVETRFLVKTPSGAYGVTYRWNQEQTDATLVPEEGASQEFVVRENGVDHRQTWRYPSRSDCMRCHTSAGGFALGFNTRQLNHEQSFSSGSANIISALAQAGYLTPGTAPTGDTSSLPALTAIYDSVKPLESRARSYLDVNCSQCHQPGGPALGYWDARAAIPLTSAGILNGPLVNPGSDPANRVVAPGDSLHSILLQRLASGGSDRMPPIGSSEHDLAAEQLLSDWIISLAAPAGASRIINLSSRAEVTSGGSTLITGFTITGGGEKRILLRAVGPGLEAYGVGGVLARPALSLWSGSTQIAANVIWGTSISASELRSTAAAAGAFPLEEGSLDSALVTTLPPGGYTAHATSASGEPGIGLIEVYDADIAGAGGTAASRLTNASIRAQVGSGGGILIPGIVLAPGSPKTLLIRAVGPGLAAYNVPGFLAQPSLSVYRGSSILASNTRWNTAPNADVIRAESTRAGAFPLADGSADSALLLTLEPGGYTIHVSSTNGVAGIALVEIYEVQPD